MRENKFNMIIQLIYIVKQSLNDTTGRSQFTILLFFPTCPVNAQKLCVYNFFLYQFNMKEEIRVKPLVEV